MLEIEPMLEVGKAYKQAVLLGEKAPDRRQGEDLGGDFSFWRAIAGSAPKGEMGGLRGE